MTIYDNIDESGEYHAKQNKSDGKSREPYEFTHMWDIKLKATNEQARQADKQKLIDTDNTRVITKGFGGRKG